MMSSICDKEKIKLITESSKFSVKTPIVDHALSVRVKSTSNITSYVGIYRNVSTNLTGSFKVTANENMNFSSKGEMKQSTNSNINSYANVALSIKDKLLSSGTFKIGITDKFVGYKPEFQATNKLYPIADISFKNKFTNTNITVKNDQNQTSNLYSNIDEGIFAGNYTSNNQSGYLLSDDSKTLIFTSNVFNSGDLEYKLRINYPFANPSQSYFAIRLQSPFDDYFLRRPQQYKIYDIKLEDPSGNLIIKYDDIIVRGDNNFTTYIAKPVINNAAQPTWISGFPYMDSGSPLFLETKPYSLTLNFAYECLKNPFANKFDFGYEQSCISGSLIKFDDPNPFDSLFISAIEIGNSGGVGIKKDNYLNCFTKVRSTSERVKKIILPNRLFTTNFNNGIYPEASSVWKTPDNLFTNQTESQVGQLLQRLRNNSALLGDYITLSYSNPTSDSGRLVLKFDNNRDELNVYSDGAFNFGGSQSFNDSKIVSYKYEDYYDIDYAELKVIAKKRSGGSDYPIDVVGYSDDKLLYVTSPVGGFLQNSGSLPFDENNVPNVSGINQINFGLSSSSISDQSEYFNNDISPLGDHYILNNSILVNSTEFKEYNIPLQIYQDPRKLGYTRYSLSSYFENLFIDICPIPSGASIAHISLVLYYKPANALMLHTLGSPSNKNAIEKNIILLPTGSGTIDSLNQPSGLLTKFGTPNYLFSNFARRWRGHTGNLFIEKDFDRSEFDFSFNHQQSDTSFLSYVDFTNTNTNTIYDHKNSVFAQSLNNINVLSNFGWRYSSDQIINNTTPYKSISWNSNIYDSFDRALRVNENLGLKSINLNLSNNFTLFIKYTPDNIDPIDLENYVILSYENNSDWGLVLAVENGALTLKVKNTNNYVKVLSDNNSIFNYLFPLSILITHDAEDYHNFRLYVNDQNFNFIGNIVLYNEPIPLTNASILFGFSQSYPYPPYIVEPVSIFIHEIGYSNTYNITQNTPGEYSNKISVNNFFDSYNVLSDYIDSDISKWNLGSFKICAFSPDFNSYTKREDKDYITFNLDHHGSGYSQFTNKPLPSNINLSGVSYHTQIENDFLRFNISDIPSIDQNRFHAIAPRISKNLPNGYNFREQALCVDTLLEHETYNNLFWPDGNNGPKLIVSLYTPTQEHPERPSKMFGLMNRSIHYLEPSGCIRKITSKFTFNDLLDNSEPWASFDSESYNKEFKEKYFLDDVNQMFLQYDLVYPSGSPYKSKIKIHNTNIRVNNAIYLSDQNSGVFSLYTSGANYQFNTLNLFCPENGPSISGGYFNLYANGHLPIKIHESGLKLFIDSSGYFVQPQGMNTYVAGNGSVDSGEELFAGLFGATPYKGMSLSVSGQLMTETVMPLHTYGMAYSSNNSLNFVNYAQEGLLSIDNILPLRMRGMNASFNAYPSSIMPLCVYNNETFIDYSENSFNLYLQGFDPTVFNISGNLPLVTLNYPISDSLASTSATIKWDSNNIGQGITSLDNVYAYVDSDDNIRGVDLACYGSCNQ